MRAAALLVAHLADERDSGPSRRYNFITTEARARALAELAPVKLCASIAA